jgi:hypothetical protein
MVETILIHLPKMLNFSADTDSKHQPGLQPKFACKTAEKKENCRVNDNGIKNQHGVWFIPGDGITAPPPKFDNFRFVDGSKIPVLPKH